MREVSNAPQSPLRPSHQVQQAIRTALSVSEEQQRESGIQHRINSPDTSKRTNETYHSKPTDWRTSRMYSLPTPGGIGSEYCPNSHSMSCPKVERGVGSILRRRLADYLIGELSANTARSGPIFRVVEKLVVSAVIVSLTTNCTLFSPDRRSTVKGYE